MTQAPPRTGKRWRPADSILVVAFILLSIFTLMQSYSNRVAAEDRSDKLSQNLDTSKGQTGQLINQVEGLGKKPVVTKEQIPESIPGPKGEPGIPGLAGRQGDPGPMGPMGPQGQRGLPGNSPACLLEPSRCVGAAGKNGVNGDPGENGTNGVDGEQGPAGPQGDAGPQGPAGPEGATGDQGPKGDQGIEGPAGPTGPQGPAGPQGPSGNLQTSDQCAAQSGTYVTDVDVVFNAETQRLELTCTHSAVQGVTTGVVR